MISKGFHSRRAVYVYFRELYVKRCTVSVHGGRGREGGWFSVYRSLYVYVYTWTGMGYSVAYSLITIPAPQRDPPPPSPLAARSGPPPVLQARAQSLSNERAAVTARQPSTVTASSRRRCRTPANQPSFLITVSRSPIRYYLFGVARVFLSLHTPRAEALRLLLRSSPPQPPASTSLVAGLPSSNNQ